MYHKFGIDKYLKYINTNMIYTHFTFENSIALTCIWSPAKTILVFLLANARGMIVSHSIACAASSNRMCVKKPVKQRYQQLNET